MAVRPGARSLLTTSEAAEYLDVSAATLRRWSEAGLVAHERTDGGHRRFRVEALEALAASQRRSEPASAERALALLEMQSTLQMQALLLEERGRLGSWWAVAESLRPAVVELHRRVDAGRITRSQWATSYDRLTRALQRLQEASPPVLAGPSLLLGLVPTDPLALVPSLLELCAGEAGWRTRWGGHATPEELAAELGREPPDAVILNASVGTDRALLRRLAPGYVAAAGAAGAPIGLIGLGPWPAELPAGVRLQGFTDARRLLERLRHGRLTRATSTEAPGGAGAPPAPAGPPAWTPLQAMGDPELDAQHQAIFEQAARLHEAIERGEAAAEVARTLTFLSMYAARHFRAEEALMEAAGFPGLTEHVWEHERFTRQVLALQEQASAGTLQERSLAEDLMEWLRLHVGGTDQRLAAFLRARGGGTAGSAAAGPEPA